MIKLIVFPSNSVGVKLHISTPLTIPLASLQSPLALITSEQIRAARALLRISVLEISQISGIGVATIKRVEASSGLPSANLRTIDSIKRALESAGIEFVGTPEDRPGVRLTRPESVAK